MLILRRLSAQNYFRRMSRNSSGPRISRLLRRCRSSVGKVLSPMSSIVVAAISAALPPRSERFSDAEADAPTPYRRRGAGCCWWCRVMLGTYPRDIGSSRGHVVSSH
jgi:hypothetical protein